MSPVWARIVPSGTSRVVSWLALLDLFSVHHSVVEGDGVVGQLGVAVFRALGDGHVAVVVDDELNVVGQAVLTGSLHLAQEVSGAMTSVSSPASGEPCPKSSWPLPFPILYRG